MDVDNSVVDIANKICNLDLMEAMKLNDLLKEKLNISDADLGIGIATVAQGGVGDNASAEDVKLEFTIIIGKYDPSSKTKLIKEAKKIMEANTGVAIGLMDVKKMVESGSFTLCEKVSKDKLDEYSVKLKDIGVEFTVE